MRRFVACGGVLLILASIGCEPEPRFRLEGSARSQGGLYLIPPAELESAAERSEPNRTSEADFQEERTEDWEDWAPKPHEDFAERVLTTPSLLRLAVTRDFRRGTERERRRLVREWIGEYARTAFGELSEEDQARAVKRLSKLLDDLLTERGFRVPGQRREARPDPSRT